MAYGTKAREWYESEIAGIKGAGLLKEERYIRSPQDAEIDVEYPAGAPPKHVINLCANNYLGLSSHPDVVAAARKGLDTRGYGMSSVRFICGTQDIHRDLERRLTAFLGTEDTLLFPSCMDANAGVFEAILGEQDVTIADRLIHASLVDGIRLCKATQDSYKHSDMGHLEEKLQLHQDKRFRMIVTDGVFSMDGDLAKLDEIVALAEKYDAMVCVDDSHSTGFIGKTGRGTQEHCGVVGKIDVITTTLGKAMGGASGGCVSGRKELVEMCRQRARPYLFSNTVAPVIVAGAIKVLEILCQVHGPARQAGVERVVLAQAPRGRGLRREEGRQPDRAGDALQRQARAGRGARPVRRRHLRGGVLLPGGAEGAGADPHPALGGAREGAPRPRDRRRS